MTTSDRCVTVREGTAPLGLYVHWPFCLSKCPYCDFNSHVRERVDQARWRNALLKELEHFAARLAAEGPADMCLQSVFFGGGTPSLMPPETVAAVISRAKTLWPSGPDLEVTLEANPTSSEAGRFAAYAQSGVNRLSLGVQALDDRALKFLGRQHDRAEALQAIALARAAFARTSFDLIYARPDQEIGDWTRELDEALSLEPAHISLYQLTIEEGTVFHGMRRRGDLRELPEARASDLFIHTRNQLSEAGLPAYEVSNHARLGMESRHNLTYWESGDYLGIGPGAHGRITLHGTRYATRQHRAPEAWLELVESQGHATRQQEGLSADEHFNEFCMMGLRLTHGIARADFTRHFGKAPEDSFARARLDALLEDGLLILDDAGLRASEKGLLRLNALLGYLLG